MTLNSAKTGQYRLPTPIPRTAAGGTRLSTPTILPCRAKKPAANTPAETGTWTRKDISIIDSMYVSEN